MLMIRMSMATYGFCDGGVHDGDDDYDDVDGRG